MTIHLPGAALPRDLHDLLGSHSVGFDQDELAIVREGRGIGSITFVRQVTRWALKAWTTRCLPGLGSKAGSVLRAASEHRVQLS